ncbi:hypothetical protein HOG48_04680 [Candidatus Peregrinibacteria bacterium]|nr:hypothetical protein [Candidatus Peregrinibacteria bacterium]
MKALNYIIGSSIIVISFGAGAVLSLANPLLSTAPTDNDTTANFDLLTIDDGTAANSFRIADIGGTRVLVDLEQPGVISAGVGLITLPSNDSSILSENGGIRGEALSGIRAQNSYNSGPMGRVALEGTVRTPSTSATGYVGFTEYDPSPHPSLGETTIEDGVPVGLIATSAPGSQHVPISQGIPWAFYTEDNSNLGDVEITGNIVSGFFSNAITLNDNVEVNGTVYAWGDIDSMYDLVITEPLWVNQSYSSLRPQDEDMNQIFMVASRFSPSKNTSGALQSFGHSVSCPDDSIRISCDMRIDQPTNSSPLQGLQKTGTSTCTANMVHEDTKTLSFYVFASCWRPNIPGVT